MRLQFDELRFGSAVGERHVLQFALATGVADWAIERMIAEQQFDHALSRLANFIAVGRHYHAFVDAGGAGGLELWHLLDPHEAHTARALEGKIRVVAESWDFDAGGLTGLDEQRAGRRGDRLPVNRDIYEFWSFGH